MNTRIKQSLSNKFIREKVYNDFCDTFIAIDIDKKIAKDLTENVINILNNEVNLDIAESKINDIFNKLNVRNLINEKVKDRSIVIFNQIKEYVEDIKGNIIDYGAGDGVVADMLNKNLGSNIVGYDVSLYPKANINIPVFKFDGKNIDCEDNYFEVAIIINVIHHEAENEYILKELTRIVKSKIIVIETVPIGNNEEEINIDRERTFMNDYLYNRLFHYGDNVPVPGTYETPIGWQKRFEGYGWKTEVSIDLGVDQKVIKDTHHLFVFEK